MTRGVVLMAFNNDQVDYGLIALCNALMIKKNLKTDVQLITDAGSLAWLKTSKGKLVEDTFHTITVVDEPEGQMRPFNDTLSTTRILSWKNANRASAYRLSVFDETLLLDCDYLIMDANLNKVWGSTEDIMINRKAMTVDCREVALNEQYLNVFGIPMYWATAVYFKKSPLTETLFNLVDLIREENSYYSYIFRFPDKLFRNDYAFSIAIHMMSGFREGGVASLPTSSISTSFDTDELLDFVAINHCRFLVQQPTDQWKFNLVSTHENVHVMNKFSITRQADRIIELYS